MQLMAAYIPMDRRRAIARGEMLPDRTQGTALFADISGYTPMIEALVQELGPKRGADEVTLRINSVFEALIAEVHRYGGSAISFGGDAITCWLEGDTGHQATTCALAMQQVMARFDQIETPSGISIPLSIKVGVAGGPVRRFQLGDSQVQYLDVLAGNTLDRMAGAEKVAEKGEVVVGPEIVSVLGETLAIRQWRSKNEADPAFAVVERFAPHSQAPSPRSLPAEAPPLTGAQIRPWLLPPVYDRLRTGQAHFLADIRPVVSLFLRFSGLAYDRDNSAGQKLDAYIQWIQHVLVSYEGYLLKVTVGDKGSTLLATFGAPLGHDDDTSRAVAAALQLQKSPAEFDFIKTVQIGINQGRVLAGAFGSASRCSYDLLGHEVNMAARLMTTANPGQILVSQSVAETAIRGYDFDYLGSMPIKGKQERMPIFEVLADHSPFLSEFPQPLVGRKGEMARVTPLLKAVLAGEGRILRIEGVAGIGKSHLAAELIEQARSRGLRVVTGACQSTRQNIPYDPWRRIFWTLLALADERLAGEEREKMIVRQINQVEAEINRLNPNWRLRLPLLGDLLGLPIPDNKTTRAFEPRLRREALTTLVVEMIRTWAQAQPLLLLVDDIHWLDEASRELLLALSRAIARIPVLLLVVHRPQDRPVLPDLNRLPYHHPLNLEELTEPGIAALVADRLQGPPSPLALSFIEALAHGNPLFLEELVNNLRETDNLHRSSNGTWTLSEELFDTLREANCLARDPATGEWKLEREAQLSAANLDLPNSVNRIVQARLDRLPEAHRLSLKVASVIGRDFDLPLLAQAHPARPGQQVLLEQLLTLLSGELIRQERVQPHPIYRFRHTVIQEVAYGSLLESQQRQLHRAVGMALENLQPGEIERLAYHYSRSGDRTKALFYLESAARKTQREYANQTALNYYNQALALEENWERRKGQVEVLHILGQREPEMTSLQALTSDPAAPPSEVAYLWSQYYEMMGKYERAETEIKRALAIERSAGDVDREVLCLTQLGEIAWRQGDYDQAKTWYNRALATFQDSSQEQPILIETLNGLGTIHRQEGDFDHARKSYERALQLSRESGHLAGEAHALNRLGITAFYRRNFTEALSYHQQTLKIRRIIGDRTGEGASLNNLAMTVRELGDYSQAEAFLTEALAIQQMTGNRWDEVNAWNDLGILYHELGDLSTAQSCLEQGLDVSQEIGDEAGQAYLLSNLGLVMRDKDDLAEAEKCLTTGLNIFKKENNKYEISFFLSYLSTVNLQAGRYNQSIAQAEKALALRRELGLHLNIIDDQATLAAAHLGAGNVTEALVYAQEVLSNLEADQSKKPEFPQRDYFICYQVLEAAQQPELAFAALQSAYNLIMIWAEKITDPTLRRSFLERVPVNREILAAVKRKDLMSE